jgi:hypothetical protein
MPEMAPMIHCGHLPHERRKREPDDTPSSLMIEFRGTSTVVTASQRNRPERSPYTVADIPLRGGKLYGSELARGNSVCLQQRSSHLKDMIGAARDVRSVCHAHSRHHQPTQVSVDLPLLLDVQVGGAFIQGKES